MPFCIGWVENFDEIALSCMVKEIEANFRFSIFGKNSKWLPYVGRGIFFKNCQGYTGQIPCGFIEIALSRTVKETEANLRFFHFRQKLKNSKWPPFLGRVKYFENCQ